MRSNDAEVLESSYQNYVKTIPRKPTFTPKGIQFILDMLAPQMHQAKPQPEQFYDAGVLNELDKEGFFVELSKRYPVKWTSKGTGLRRIRHSRARGIQVFRHRPALPDTGLRRYAELFLQRS